VSSAEAPRFAEVVTRFTERIRALGPNRAATPEAAAETAA
jgi:F420-non-reducing hydrogenase iron-sulfur subunit